MTKSKGLDDRSKSLLYKIYANAVQQIRQDFGLGQERFQRDFLDDHGVFLKDGGEFFFSIGDVASAEGLFRISKEKALAEYFAFFRAPKSRLNNYLPLSSYERRFVNRLKVLRNEYFSLSGRLKDAGSSSTDKNVDELKDLLGRTWRDALSHATALLVNQSNSKERLLFSRASIAIPVIYISVHPSSVAFLIQSGERSKKVKVDINRAELRKIIFELIVFLSRNDRRWEDSLSHLNNEVLGTLYKALMFFEGDKFRVVTDDVFTLIPWGLINSSFKSDKVSGALILQGAESSSDKTKYGVSEITPSALTVDVFVNSSTNSDFPPLPYAALEGEFLTKHAFQNLSKASLRMLYLNDHFTKSSLKTSLTQGRDIIHIATHFRMSKHKNHGPGFLAGDGSFLDLRSLAPGRVALNRIGLLTLSACDSQMSLQAVPEVARATEGAASFFALYGVKNIVSTLWKVSDQATYDFMRIFYLLYLDEKLDVPDALMYVKRIFRSGGADDDRGIQDRYPNVFSNDFKKRLSSYKPPFYWAAFTAFSSAIVK